MKVTKQQARVLAEFRDGATSKDIKQLLEDKLEEARDKYELNPVNEDNRGEVVGFRTVLEVLYKNKLEVRA